MIKIDPITCAGCQRCCHGTPGHIIPVKLQDSTEYPYINNHGRCQYLNSQNICYLPKCHSKPIECSIYPIVIFEDGIYVDMSCPAWKDAVRQWSERFDGRIDDYDDNEHKFVKLYLAKMIKDDSIGYHDVDEFYKE